MSTIVYVEAQEPGLIDAVARHIVERHRSALPNLASLIILLPNLRAAAVMQAALRNAAGLPVLLLPTITTLQGLAASVPLTAEPLPDSRRTALVYTALRDGKWFAGADLWHVAGELVALFDELTRSQVRLPDSQEKFVAQLEQAYQARAGAPMQFEARLVHELWHALHAGSSDQPVVISD